MGQHVHATLADFLSIVPIENRTQETVEKLLNEKWAENREGFKDSEEEKKWRGKALDQLRSFVKTQRVDIKPLKVEGFHEAPITEDLILMGKIDRFDLLDNGSIHIIDYKTGNVPEKQDDFQLLLYVLILSRTLTYSVSKVSYLYLADGVWHTFTITDDAIQDAKSKALEVAKQINQERDYPEVAGPLCKFCDFLEICDVGKQSQPIT